VSDADETDKKLAAIDFGVTGQCHRVHFAIHHEPCFTGGLAARCSGADRRQRAKLRDQSHPRHVTILPPVESIKRVKQRI